MANEQDLMAMMSGGPAAGGALPPGAPPSDTTPPIPTPMSTPEPKNGQREAALINVFLAALIVAAPDLTAVITAIGAVLLIIVTATIIWVARVSEVKPPILRA